MPSSSGGAGRATGGGSFSSCAVAALACAALLAWATPADAYIGPGAGFAFVTSFFVFFLTFILALFAFLSWPIRYVIRALRKKPGLKKAQVDRVVVCGLDGMAPELAQKFMDEGKMPNMKRLAEAGTFAWLDSTTPSISPVAWSSFSTGTNPGRHNIYDFLTRDPRTYLPMLSSADVGAAPRTLKIGKYAFPIGKPSFKFMRKSKAFWTILGENGVFSSVLRVPITFPAEKFNGVMLSAMGAPDLRGTQGTFSFYTTAEGGGKESIGAEHTGGVRIPTRRDGDLIRSEILGPPNSLLQQPVDMRIPFTVRPLPKENAALLEVGKEKVKLPMRRFSPWVRLEFKAAPLITVKGIAQFVLLELEPELKLYMTPINIDPQNPALPISHPSYYSDYLAKLNGDYSTLGLCEDTWALNERIIDEDIFLEQCWQVDDEREKQFMNDIDKVRKGVCVCVFDAVDRVQHMFMRFLEDDHPGVRGQDVARHRGVMEELYTRCDRMVGRIMEKLGPKDVLFVMSDHGFKQFRRGINLNSWLWKNGYLALKEGKTKSGEWFEAVDWERTRAFAIGLAGMYLNVKGREAKGIVEPDEAMALMKELQQKLAGLRDEEKDAVGIDEIFIAREVYRGPYVKEAPDMIVGYSDGYRGSWDAAVGIVDDIIFEDNVKAWGSDHCMNPAVVPGVFFSSRKLARQRMHIMDVAPSILELFGLAPPSWMDGKTLWRNGAEHAPAPEPAAAATGVVR